MMTIVLWDGGTNMAKNRIYDCYAYLCIDHIHNMYPIRNPKIHLDSIFKLKHGDLIYIKGKGQLKVRNIVITEYPYRDRGKDGLYQEVGINCITIE